MTNYAERRVLAIMFANPALAPALKAEDFKYVWHQIIFKGLSQGNDVTVMDIADDVKAYLLGLDEDWTPQNLELFARLVREDADQRRFAESMGRLK